MQNKIISLISKAVAEETNEQLACVGSGSYLGSGFLIIHNPNDYPEYGRIHYHFDDHEAKFKIESWGINMTIKYTDAIGWVKLEEQVRSYARGCHEWADECCQMIAAYKNSEDFDD